MNERIRELITQARGHWNHGDFNMPSSVEFQEQDIERFAELIVQECCEVVKWTPSQFPNDEYVKNIKEHFGVEE